MMMYVTEGTKTNGKNKQLPTGVQSRTQKF